MSMDLPNAAEARRILHERALALARPPAHSIAAPSGDAQATAELAGDTGSVIDVLEFRLGQEAYAVELRFVREITALKNLTQLPCTPDFIAGVVDVRGRIVAVLDLKKFFGLPDTGLTDLHRIIHIEGAELEFGLLADVGVGARSIAVASLQAALPTLTGIGAEYLRGVTAESLVVLDIARILADPKIIVDEDVAN